MDLYWDEVLETKVQLADKVILLGNVARDFINSKPKTWSQNKQFLELIHPSRLNYKRIMDNKDKIIKDLKEFIFIIK
jgi:uracil-DNA glycosylase